MGSLRAQGFFMRTVKTLIRLGRCPLWSESSLGAHAILLVLSWGGWNEDGHEKKDLSIVQFVILQTHMRSHPAGPDSGCLCEVSSSSLYEPHHEKTCLRGLGPGKTQTTLLTYRDQLESWNLDWTSLDTIQSRQRTTKVVISLHECAGWSAPLLFTYGKNRFSHDEAHIMWVKTDVQAHRACTVHLCVKCPFHMGWLQWFFIAQSLLLLLFEICMKRM